MKKLIVLSLLMLVATTSFAQGLFEQDVVVVEGSFAPLMGVSKIQVEEDWEGTTIEGMSQAAWLEFRKIEQPEFNPQYELENELKPQLSIMLLPAANDKLRTIGRFLTNASESDILMTIHPVNITKKGNCYLNITIRDKMNGQQIVKFSIEGKGGIFGSMANLWSDGFKSAGKRLGKLLVKQLR